MNLNRTPAPLHSRRSERTRRDRRIVGWREWVSLPDFGIGAIEAKLDTGAKTSALHAWDRELCEIDGRAWLRFSARPFRNDDGAAVRCVAPLADRRWVMNTGGEREWRYVIAATLGVGGEAWPIEITLANRDQMGFRMLIGRGAMRGRLVVDPTRSWVMGRRSRPDGKLSPRKVGKETAA